MKHFLCYIVEPESGVEQIHVVSEKDVPAFKKECLASKGYQVCTAAILLPENKAVHSTWMPSYVDKDAYENGVSKALSDWNKREKEIIDAENSMTWTSSKLRWR